MGAPLRTSKYWLERAEECRVLADAFHNRDTRERMRRVAQDHQRMGDQAASRELAEAHSLAEAHDLLGS
jgi:hypothetical protein